MGSSELGLEFDRGLQIVGTIGQVCVDVSFRTKHEGFSTHWFQDNVDDAHRRLAGLVCRFEGKQDASFRVGLSKNLSQFIQ